MKNWIEVNRRRFLAGVSSGMGAAVLAQAGVAGEKADTPNRQQVWIATISLAQLGGETAEEMVGKVLNRAGQSLVCGPDIICLPEAFPYYNVSQKKTVKEAAEPLPGWVVQRFAEFAEKNRCYVICPLEIRDGDTFYNSAVLIDRQGKVAGAYHKIHPTVDEIESGVMPGPLEPPVFQTDFGTIGIQICFDVNWPDGWRRLRKAGAEIIFWPSAFPGGRMLNAMAWMNKSYIVTSTWPGPSRIIDITGGEIAASGRFEHWVCAPVNLEKAFIHIWPYLKNLDGIRAKYGQKVRVVKMHDEDWAIVECVSPELRIKDVLAEFELPTHEEHIQKGETAQNKTRRS